MSHLSHPKNKDPFAVQPMPKSFYFPSRTKHSLGQEAIEAPYRTQDQVSPSKQEWQQLNSNMNNNTESVRPNLPEHTERKDNTSGLYPEAWPSSPSGVADVSQLTACSNFTATDDSTVDLQEAVDRLQFYNRHGGHETDNSGSVMKMYIDRFRKCEPKSREERRREHAVKTQDFWWLQDQSASDNIVRGEAADMNAMTHQGHPQQQRLKLTKELLSAMDKETLQLQSKADKLLSQSESSMSSGPIVSTRGLGSSCSNSDHSSVVEAPAYRPAFVNRRDDSPVEHTSKLMLRMKENAAQHGTTTTAAAEAPAGLSKPYCGDILAQWRFRRKMEETHKPSTINAKPVTGPAGARSNLDCGMDARLEEFRKKLLSHRCAVTPQDVQFERQRMDLLTGKDDQMPPAGDRVCHQVTDPILTRLQGITKQQKHSTGRPEQRPPDTSSCNQNTNNSTFRPVAISDMVLDAATIEVPAGSSLDKNNTASSKTTPCCGQQRAVTVDHFGEQVLGRAKSDKYDLNEEPDRELNVCINSDKLMERPLRDLSVNHNSPRVHKPSRRIMDGVENSSDGDRNMGGKGEKGNDNIYHQYLEAEKPSSDESERITEQVIGKQVHEPNEICTRSSQERERKQKSNDKTQTTHHRLTDKDASHKVPCKSNKKGKPLSRKMRHQNVELDQDTSETNSQISQSSIVEAAVDGHTKQKTRAVSSSSYVESDVTPSSKCQPMAKVIKETSEKSSLLINQVSKQTTNQKLKNKVENTKKSTGSVLTSSKHPTPAMSPAQPVKKAIGQAITEHLFDHSGLVSSVDSWASVFPPSPCGKSFPDPQQQSPASTLNSTNLDVITPEKSQEISTNSSADSPDQYIDLRNARSGRSSVEPELSNAQLDDKSLHSPVECPTAPLQQSTPQRNIQDSCCLDISDDSLSSEEFTDDPLLKILREQRDKYVAKLGLIEQQLSQLDLQAPSEDSS